MRPGRLGHAESIVGHDQADACGVGLERNDDLTARPAVLQCVRDEVGHRAAKIVPVGEGDIDYRPIFAQAALAGMKYYFVEQDSAPASGDSMKDAGKSQAALIKLLG
jgi:sugar phosphate isomerase/epimerase